MIIIVQSLFSVLTPGRNLSLYFFREGTIVRLSLHCLRIYLPYVADKKALAETPAPNIWKLQTAGLVSESMGSVSMGIADTQKMYRWSPCPGGGAAPQNPANPASFLSIFAPAGSLAPPTSPAPVSNDVTDAGISYAIQCQNPDTVGASGSKHVTTNDFVSSGNPFHDSWGD